MIKHLAILAVAAIATYSQLLIDNVSAHPGATHHVKTPEQLAQRQLFMANSKRLLENCANSDATRKLQERTATRRAAKLRELRAEQQQRRRLDIDTVLATSHLSNRTGLTANTTASELFGSDVKCVLEPEATQGPYYVAGEFVRSDIREDQRGVDLYADLQIVDVNTCEPVENLYIDFWHCNATGVYSGVVASSNGDSSVASNINATFSRGLSPTDADGLVSFTTIFPGHYTGRAIHIHVLGTYNGTLLENNTYSGGYSSHVGQVFFDQDLITEVEKTSPYSTNKQELLLNANDGILQGEAATGFDPVMEYVLVGDDVSDGILAWISIGVDMTRAEKITPAVQYTENGGIAVSGGGGGGGGGGGVPPGPPRA